MSAASKAYNSTGLDNTFNKPSQNLINRFKTASLHQSSSSVNFIKTRDFTTPIKYSGLEEDFDTKFKLGDDSNPSWFQKIKNSLF
ncbi:hypothetical protein AYI69_g5739 [Smittium culicis]|uniref:Uncharacterized protein n=1 Tax=Smittium culicis TaxID=133412 RepID=A0A1R1Y4B5_9FUNG|nr:hypothetical protein AYI69_g5739 [Smittium culicis]